MSPPPQVRGRTIVIGAIALVVVIAVSAIALPLWQAKHDVPVLDDYGVVAPFKLTDETGAAFTEQALAGHVTIVDFIFTRCDSICPASTAKMAKILDDTADQPDIKLVSFSVDPTYDTPPRLAAYAKQFGADESRWRFVTGDLAAVRKVVTDAMMMGMDPDGRIQPNGAPNIAHTAHFLLISPDLHIVGIYDSTEVVKLDKLVRDARGLARATAAGG